MKICWDNLEKIKKYVPSSGIFYTHSICNKGTKYLYNDSCTVCGDPYLARYRNKLKYDKCCSLSCARSGNGNHQYIDGRSSDTEYQKEYERNRDRSEYYKNNGHYFCMANAKRRAMKLDQTPDDANQEKIKRKYEMCRRLNVGANRTAYHVDHIIPLSKGGLHHEDNLQILPATINLSKGANLMPQHIQ